MLAKQAPDQPTTEEKKEAEMIANASRTASFLAQELRAATRTTDSLVAEDEHVRADKAKIEKA